MIALPPPRFGSEHVDGLLRLAGLHPDHREAGERRRLIGRETTASLELLLRGTELRAHRENDAALQMQE